MFLNNVFKHRKTKYLVSEHTYGVLHCHESLIDELAKVDIRRYLKYTVVTILYQNSSIECPAVLVQVDTCVRLMRIVIALQRSPRPVHNVAHPLAGEADDDSPGSWHASCSTTNAMSTLDVRRCQRRVTAHLVVDYVQHLTRNVFAGCVLVDALDSEVRSSGVLLQIIELTL